MHSAAISHSLIVRSAGIRPEIPNYLRPRIAIASMRWYELCNAKSSAALFSPTPFKPLSPETIKAKRTNSSRSGFNVSEHADFIAVQQG
jgi:hypothetical protein